MAVIRTPFVWNPALAETMARLGVDESNRDAFGRALDGAARGFAPFLLVREVTIDAVGDGFAQLSGEWLEDARLAARLTEAQRAWVFLASAGAALPEGPWVEDLAALAAYDALADRVTAMGRAERAKVDAIATAETAALLRLLGLDGIPGPEAALGVLYTAPVSPGSCGGCGGCGNCSSDCAGCDARRANA